MKLALVAGFIILSSWRVRKFFQQIHTNSKSIVSASIGLDERRKSHPVAHQLGGIGRKIAPKRFMRIQRSFIVSLDKITSMTKTPVQVGKKLITIGDQYRDTFAVFVGKWI